MTEHTKEPWGWREVAGGMKLVGDHSDIPFVLDAGGSRGAHLRGRGPKPVERMQPLTPDMPDAERIVACVNHCAGLKPEGIPKAVEALRRVVREMDMMRDQYTGPEWAAIEGARAALRSLGLEE